MESLVTTEWLAGQLGASDLRIVDASYFLPEHGRNARAEFEAAHIPGAVFLDLGDLADTASDLPMMLPSAEKFASRCQAIGLGDGSRIIVYDNSPLKTSARAWWMLTVFGAHEVAILDGGLEKWKTEGRPLESGKPVVRHRHFTVWKDVDQVLDLAQMKENLKTRKLQVVDARSAARFRGDEPESRPGVRPGHIPGSANLPYSVLFNADGTWKQGDALREAFAAHGIDLDRPIVTTCGSGITAASLSFALTLLGVRNTALYDGAWTEWGGRDDTPVVTGTA